MRFTVKFLAVLAALLLLPLLGFGLFCLVWVFSAALHSGDGFGVCLASALFLVCFLAVMAVFLGALWMSRLIRSRYPVDNPYTWPPDHPVISLSKPLLIAVQVYVVIAILAWVGGMITGADVGLVWLGFWAAIGGVCGTALQWIGKHWNR